MAISIVPDAAREQRLLRRDEMTDRLMAAGFVAAVFLSACTDVLGQLVEAPGDRWAAVLPSSVVQDVDRYGTPRARAALVWVRGDWGREAVEALGCGHAAGTLAPLTEPHAATPWRRGGTDAPSRIADAICHRHPAAPTATWPGAWA